jgi:hypothetical protein
VSPEDELDPKPAALDDSAVMSSPMIAQDLPQDRRKAVRIVQVRHVVARKLDGLDAKASSEGLSGAELAEEGKPSIGVVQNADDRRLVSDQQLNGVRGTCR